MRIIIGILFVFIFLNNSALSRTPYDERLRQAEKLLDSYSGERQSLYEAGKIISDVIKEAPTNSKAYVLAGILIMSGGHIVENNYQENTLETALEMYKKAIALDNKNAEAYMLMGRVEIKQKNYPQALNSLDSAKRINPRLVWLTSSYGMYYQGIRDFSKAKQMYLQIKREGPGKTLAEKVCYLDALDSLASLAAFENDKYSLRILAREVEKITLPQKAWVIGNMANYFFAVAMFDEGIEYSRKALAIMNYGAARKALAKNLYGKACINIRADQPAANYIEEAQSLGYDAFSLVSEFASENDALNSLLPYMAKIYNLRIDERGVGHKQYR